MVLIQTLSAYICGNISTFIGYTMTGNFHMKWMPTILDPSCSSGLKRNKGTTSNTEQSPGNAIHSRVLEKEGRLRINLASDYWSATVRELSIAVFLRHFGIEGCDDLLWTTVFLLLNSVVNGTSRNCALRAKNNARTRNRRLNCQRSRRTARTQGRGPDGSHRRTCLKYSQQSSVALRGSTGADITPTPREPPRMSCMVRDEIAFDRDG